MTRKLSIRVSAIAVVLLSASFSAHADMSACSSAYVKGGVDVAIELYTRCITGGDMTKGNLAGAFTNRGVLYMEKGEYDKALADMSSAIRFNPRFGLPYFNRASIYLSRGDLDAAYADLSMALKYGPSRIYADAYSRRADLQYARGNCAGAVADIDAALVRSSKRGDWQAFKAWVLATCADERERNGAEALKAAQKAVALQDYWEAHQAMAVAYAELGRFDESVAEMQAAKDLAAKVPGAWRPQHEDMLASFKAGKAFHAGPGTAAPVSLEAGSE